MSAFPESSSATFARPVLVLGNRVLLKMYNNTHGLTISDVKLNEQVKSWIRETAKSKGWATVRFLSTRVELTRSFSAEHYKQGQE